MTTYRVSKSRSGKILGDYDGATPLDAYRAMMADAGYNTEADAKGAGYTLASIPDTIMVEIAGGDDGASAALKKEDAVISRIMREQGVSYATAVALRASGEVD